MNDRRIRVAIVSAIVASTMTLYQSIPLLPFFSLTYVRNTGAAFGLLGELPLSLRLPLFVLVTIGAVWALLSQLRQVRADETWLAVALGGILGGAAGNLVCRVRFGEVVDFLHLHYRSFDWPMFNVADSAITVGVALVLLHSLRASDEAPAKRPASEAR